MQLIVNASIESMNSAWLAEWLQTDIVIQPISQRNKSVYES